MPTWIFVVAFAYMGTNLLIMSYSAINEWLAKDHPLDKYAGVFWWTLILGTAFLSMVFWDGKSYHF